ncbi:MAG: carboxypeptidase-like regulatory domain-containing protein [Candidatus Acidiferrum sp.]
MRLHCNNRSGSGLPMTLRVMRLLSLVIIIFCAPALRAQSSPKKVGTGIQGTVLGANGKPVPAAAVTCQSSAGVRPRIVHTDNKGHYSISGLKQDSYDLRATANGAYSDWEKNIPLRNGQTKEITLHLLNGNTALSGTLPAKSKN